MNGEAFLELVKRRRSVRGFSPDPVSRRDTALMLEALRLAPSSCNTQPWRVVAVDRPELIGQLSLCAPVGTRVNRWMETAPLVFVLCAEPHAWLHRAAQTVGSDCHVLDVGIAGEHLCLMATALGLGSCWIGWFSERKVKKLLGIPRTVEVLAIIPVGRPAGGPAMPDGAPEEPDEMGSLQIQKRRKALRDLSWWNSYGGDAVDGG